MTRVPNPGPSPSLRCLNSPSESERVQSGRKGSGTYQFKVYLFLCRLETESFTVLCLDPDKVKILSGLRFISR